MSTPDNYSLWEANERRRERWLAQLPECDKCGFPIQADHYYEIEGKTICPDCLETYYKRENEACAG